MCCVVFIQIPQHREISRGEKNLRKCLLHVTAGELLIVDNDCSSRKVGLHSRAGHMLIVRDKDVKNIIVKCTLYAKPKDLLTSQNSTSNLMKLLE